MQARGEVARTGIVSKTLRKQETVGKVKHGVEVIKVSTQPEELWTRMKGAGTCTCTEMEYLGIQILHFPAILILPFS